jgi:hypothetical protein
VLASIPSDKPLVLYCNNKECGWAEMMAKSALFRRFPDVRVFRGGRDVYRMFGGRTVRGPDFEVAGP